jgi:hypothetical protein
LFFRLYSFNIDVSTLSFQNYSFDVIILTLFFRRYSSDIVVSTLVFRRYSFDVVVSTLVFRLYSFDESYYSSPSITHPAWCEINCIETKNESEKWSHLKTLKSLAQIFWINQRFCVHYFDIFQIFVKTLNFLVKWSRINSVEHSIYFRLQKPEL